MKPQDVVVRPGPSKVHKKVAFFHSIFVQHAILQNQKKYGIIDMECLPALIGVVYGHITFKSTRKLAE